MTDDNEIITVLDRLKGKYFVNFSLKNQCWFKVGGKAQYFYLPQSLEELQSFLKNITTIKENFITNVKKNNTTNIAESNCNITILGAGSNTLIRDNGVEGIVIKLQNFNNIKKLDDNLIEVDCGLLNSTVAMFAKDNNIGGLEFITGIPGSIGGGIAMNAGCFGGEFKDIIKEVRALNYQGNLVTLTPEDCNFSYRKSSTKVPMIFISCILQGFVSEKSEIIAKMEKIKVARESSQPKKVLTGGSTFANPSNEYNYKAWQLIDKVGLRGYRVGGACISEKHCNFIINDKNATAGDIEEIIEFVKAEVKKQFAIDMHNEIKIIGLK